MEPMTWTGAAGMVLNPLLMAAAVFWAVAMVVTVVVGAFAPAPTLVVNADGTLSSRAGIAGLAGAAFRLATLLVGVVLAAYLVAGLILPWGQAGIIGAISRRLLPVWLSLAVMFTLSIRYRRHLGLYGKLFDSTVGMVGFGLVMFWVFTALAVGLFDMIATHDPLSLVSGLKNKVPGVPVPGVEVFGPGSHYLLGGDNLARDVFSRMIHGSWIVVQIAPMATLFSFMAGITLGLPAGYYGGRLDTVLSFLANLILAFPVILLFYLLVTPEIDGASGWWGSPWRSSAPCT